ncbi:hypothetical protein HPB48_021835 [Haemaphysalis longicornis]|uniref:FP protein C-terminal domain-containing protein n=1 Tax=Haemaphysalis longicornis TaxID=44386 RepID=A0A9J6FWB2_HAELO|nr:hypothetical protein HPB48_021835 [Haemaphysalis longicornis]
MREIKASMTHMNKEFDDMRKDCAEVKKENAALKASNEKLLQEIALLKVQLHENSLRVTAQEQYSRNKNIEVRGIPHETTENLEDILSEVGGALGEPIQKDDVEMCHCVPTRNTAEDCTEQNIVVTFSRRAKRDAIVEKARKTRLTADDIGYTTENPVYINEHLCPQVKKLLGMTIAKKKELGWSFAWSRDGKVFARQIENSKLVRIACEADLAKMRS